MIPDRIIARKIRRINPELSIKWNAQKCRFEVWHKPLFKPAYIVTPVVQSIYDADAPVEFCPLDDRLIWYIQNVDDGAKLKTRKHSVQEWDSRWNDYDRIRAQARRADFRARAAEMWNLSHCHFTSSIKKKNGKPTFSNYEKSQFVRPDVQSQNNPRIHYRSRTNANQYNFKRK